MAGRLDGGGIDFVVFGVGAEEADEDDAVVVMDADDKAVGVAPDVEDDAVVSFWKG